MRNISKNKGQITILLGTALTAGSIVVASLGGYFGARLGLSSDIHTNKTEIERVEREYKNAVSDVNGKLDLLLENFDLKYVPKK